MKRMALIALFVSACGVPQELYNARQRDLDRCSAELTKAQSDYGSAQRNADELSTEAADLRDRVSSLQADRQKSASAMQQQLANYEAFKNATKLAEQRAEIYDQLARALQPLVDQKRVSLESVHGRLLVRMPDAELFEPGKAEVRSDGQALLRELASVLKQVNRDVLVASHTDNQPLTGTQFHSAWELTLARSVAVVRFFQGEGVDPRHLGAAGYSEFNNVTDNADENARALNRRLELIVMPAPEELIPLPQPAKPQSAPPKADATAKPDGK